MRPRHARSGRRPAALAVAPWDSPQWCPRASHRFPRCSLPMSRDACTGRRRRHTRTPAALAPLRSLAGAGRRGHEHRRPRARRGGPRTRPCPCAWRRPCPCPCPFFLRSITSAIAFAAAWWAPSASCRLASKSPRSRPPGCLAAFVSAASAASAKPSSRMATEWEGPLQLETAA
jgi:hypothetical protein